MVSALLLSQCPRSRLTAKPDPLGFPTLLKRSYQGHTRVVPENHQNLSFSPDRRGWEQIQTSVHTWQRPAHVNTCKRQRDHIMVCGSLQNIKPKLSRSITPGEWQERATCWSDSFLPVLCMHHWKRTWKRYGLFQKAGSFPDTGWDLGHQSTAVSWSRF